MASTAEQVRGYRGPAILSFGFRPFFLAGALWAALAVALWLPVLSGSLTLPTAFSPLQWHVHEMLYGYVPAIIAGFLLTAVPNWTGRLPVVGKPLLALVSLWFAGRIAILGSQYFGLFPSAVIDLSFLVALSAIVAREIIAGGDKRNLKVLVMVALLFTGNLVFHIEAIQGYQSAYGTRGGISAIVLLIMLIGGRIVPSFTRNWLARREEGRLPIPFNRFDIAAMVASAAALIAWTLAPDALLTAVLAVLAALINIWRLARWAGDRTVAEPLVVVLHFAFAFVPTGFALVALAIVRPDLVAATGALHAWTVGAIGLMTLAVMTRASLGHTGKPLTATRPIIAVYVAIWLAAMTRIVAAFDILREPMLHASAGLWVLGFAGFLAIYAPLLLRSRN